MKEKFATRIRIARQRRRLRCDSSCEIETYREQNLVRALRWIGTSDRSESACYGSSTTGRHKAAAAWPTASPLVARGIAPSDRVREIVGPDAIIGLSTHCISQVDEGQIDRPGRLHRVGPVFPGSTKTIRCRSPLCIFELRWRFRVGINPVPTRESLPAFSRSAESRPRYVHRKGFTAAGFDEIAVTAASDQKEAINSNRLPKAIELWSSWRSDADCEVVSRSSGGTRMSLSMILEPHTGENTRLPTHCVFFDLPRFVRCVPDELISLTPVVKLFRNPELTESSVWRFIRDPNWFGPQ